MILRLQQSGKRGYFPAYKKRRLKREMQQQFGGIPNGCETVVSVQQIPGGNFQHDGEDVYEMEAYKFVSVKQKGARRLVCLL